MAVFPQLLAPGRIGAMAVRNRLVMSPMETMYGIPDGLPCSGLGLIRKATEERARAACAI